MSLTATPMWSIRPKSMGGAVYRRRSAGRGVRVRRGDPRDGGLRTAGGGAVTVHQTVDVLALQHLVLEQLGGQRLECVAVLLDQPARSAHGQVGELLLLLVDDPAGGVRDGVVVGG